MAIGIALCATRSTAATIFNYTDFSSTPLTLAGDASSGTALQITSANGNRGGAAYELVTLGAGDEFSSTFEFQLTNASSLWGPANGLAFVLAADPTLLGTTQGSHLGLYGVPNSLAVAFNTYDVGGNGSSSNFVSIDKNGALTNNSPSNVYGVSSCISSNYANAGCMSNGDLWTVTLSYDGSNLSVTLQDPAEALQYTAISNYAVNLTSILGTSNTAAYVALTGGTGLAFEKQAIVSWELADAPVTPEPAPAALARRRPSGPCVSEAKAR